MNRKKKLTNLQVFFFFFIKITIMLCGDSYSMLRQFLWKKSANDLLVKNRRMPLYEPPSPGTSVETCGIGSRIFREYRTQMKPARTLVSQQYAMSVSLHFYRLSTDCTLSALLVGGKL